jgi:transcriptional regulator of acetoin/glycerol metabolism
LRERTDFVPLVEKLLDDLFPEGRLQLAPELLPHLAAYRWPGNLRQLASVLRTAAAMLDGDEREIGWTHLPDDLLDELIPPQAPPASKPRQNLEAHFRQAIQEALADSRGNLSAAARRLGISRQTMYRKLKSQG